MLRTAQRKVRRSAQVFSALSDGLWAEPLPFGSARAAQRPEVRDLHDVRRLPASHQQVPAGRHRLGVDTRQDLALRPLAGDDEGAPAGVVDRLQAGVVRRPCRPGDRSGQHHVETEVARRRQVGDERTQWFGSADATMS